MLYFRQMCGSLTDVFKSKHIKSKTDRLKIILRQLNSDLQPHHVRVSALEMLTLAGCVCVCVCVCV